MSYAFNYDEVHRAALKELYEEAWKRAGADEKEAIRQSADRAKHDEQRQAQMRMCPACGPVSLSNAQNCPNGACITRAIARGTENGRKP